jgi:apolipoprotein N-acyltransferase
MVKNQRYDKIRLFPFGEYLPFKKTIAWALINVRESGNYIPGKEFTVFELPTLRFGVTICWENIFPDLFRQFVRRGAQFMVNITNEARFGKTAAPYQLASISVFRAVENRVFVIRCANTGVSCIIDPYGRIVDRVKDQQGQDIFIRGVISGWVIPLESKTIYTRCGDGFVWVAIFGSVLFLSVSSVKTQGRRSIKKEMSI